jgi:hypothetical protein
MANIPRKPQTFNQQVAPMAANLQQLVNNAQPQQQPAANPQVQPAAAPQAAPQVQPQAHRPRPAARRVARPQAQPQAPELGFSWLFQPTGRISRISPIERGLFFLSGIGLWVWGAYLSIFFMQDTFPALRSSQLPLAAIIAGLVVSAIFMVIEFYLPKGNHAPVVWLFLVGIYVLDIYINIGGYSVLFGHTKTGLDTATFFIWIMGIATALLPERLMIKAWEK